MKPKTTMAWGRFKSADGTLLGIHPNRRVARSAGAIWGDPYTVYRVRVTPLHRDNGRKR